MPEIANETSKISPEKREVPTRQNTREEECDACQCRIPQEQLFMISCLIESNPVMTRKGDQGAGQREVPAALGANYGKN